MGYNGTKLWPLWDIMGYNRIYNWDIMRYNGVRKLWPLKCDTRGFMANFWPLSNGKTNEHEVLSL